MQLLEKVLKREGKSLSEWIRDYAAKYVADHKEGNPQLRIDKFSSMTNHKKRQPSDCHFWKPRPKAQPPYKAYCGKFKRMVVEASCCDLWKA